MEPEDPKSLLGCVEKVRNAPWGEEHTEKVRDFLMRYYSRDVLAGRFLELLVRVAGRFPDKSKCETYEGELTLAGGPR